MISSIEITRFRGIREGKLEDLTPLVVLVGPNASGKSTVLDALLVGGAPAIGDAIGRAAVRHQGVKHAARWLLWRTGVEGAAEIVVSTHAKYGRRCSVYRESLPERVHYEAAAGLSAGLASGSELKSVEGKVTVTAPNYTATGAFLELKDVGDVRIVESAVEQIQTPLHEVLTQCIQGGRRSDVRAAVAEIVPGVKDILILTEGDAPIVYLEHAGYSVPAALAGDGLHSLLRISLELASYPKGVVLLEEPEVHQHPGAIRQTMRAILAAVRRSIQVILTTHSLELIDALLAESSDEDLEKLSLYRLELADGSLISHRIPGSEVEFSRTQVEKDLR